MNRIPGLLVFAFLFMHVTACTSSAEPAKLQETLVELEGLVELKGAETFFKLKDGKIYKLEGSLVRMIRGVYKGKQIKISARITKEPSGTNPGACVVREIIVLIQ